MVQDILKVESEESTLPDKRYFKIGETSSLLGVKPHVLRYWETEFPQIRPFKSKTGQRLYRRRDVEALMKIQKLLYQERFTIAGARLALRNSLTMENESLPSETTLEAPTLEVLALPAFVIDPQTYASLLAAKADLEAILLKLEENF